MALVSTDWLKNQLAAQSNVVVIEATWFPQTKKEYLKSHIPSARHVSFNKGMDTTVLVPQNLHVAEHLRGLLRGAGAGEDSHVVVYDRDKTLWASRVWWTLRVFGHEKVSVLDGGWQAWKEQGLNTESGEPEVKEGDFSPQPPRSELMVSYEDILQILQNKNTQIVDGRQSQDFAGAGNEPTLMSKMAYEMVGLPIPTSMHCGHVPGAANLPEDSVLDPKTNCMRDPQALRELFSSVGVDPSRPVVTMCYAGIWATLSALALHVLGNHNVPVYLGSWTEYAQRASAENVETKKDTA